MALRDDAPLDGAWQRLQELLRQPCFQWARVALGDRRPDSAASLREWWTEDGEGWLRDAGGQPREKGRVVLPPDFPPSLLLKGNERSPEASILCPATDAACGLETRGWLARARDAFDTLDERHEPYDSPEGGRRQREMKVECDKAVAVAKKPEQLDAWLDCLAERRKRVSRHPVGRFRAPRRGWIVVAGRRGHYQFCDGVAAFDLATGAAATVRSCSGLMFLGMSGRVDGKKTNAARKLEKEVGAVSVDNARELALGLLLLDHTKQITVDATEATLPPGVSLEAAPRAGLGRSGPVCMESDSETTLTWSWVDGDVTRARGELTWPYSCRTGESHADKLLEILEAGLVPGCPAAVPPAIGAGAGSGAVSPLDASPEDNVATFAALRRAFARAASACAGPR